MYTMTKPRSPRAKMDKPKYGRLTPIEYVYGGKWKFECDCGAIVTTYGSSVRSGKTQSCGCLAAEIATKISTTHGCTGTPEHDIWRGIIARCTNPNTKAYKNYGGRGIKICERWLDFSNFIADVGRRPSSKHEIDRYPNNDGHYEPGNVRWATRMEQAANKRNNKLITFNGKTMHQAAWAREIGVEIRTLHARLKAGWSIERALTTN